MTDILLIKLALTPLLICALTLIGRRWGPIASGAIAGLPLTSGPISIFLAVEQGIDFASHAAVATLAGLIAVAAFCATYSLAASRTNWFISTCAGVAAFFLFAFLLLTMRLGAVATFVVVVIFLAVTLRAMPKPTTRQRDVVQQYPWWDLPLRVLVATGLVFLLTAVAPNLGPKLTGMLSPFPIFGGVLAIFAHRHFGAGDAQLVLRSVVLASFAFALFFLIVGVSLLRFGIPVSYLFATFASLMLNVALLKWQLARIARHEASCP